MFGWLKVRSWFTLVSGLVECLGFAGAVFGWASLVFVLKTEGYFSDLCVNATVNGTVTEDCREQDEQFSLIFTIASFMNNFLTLPNGFLFDHFGTTVARLLGISVYTAGMLLIAFSSPANAILLFPALSFIAVGGILFLVTNMQVGNLFGKHRSTIITLYNGAFDSSSAVFLIIKLLFEDGVSLRGSYLFLSCCSVIHLFRTFVLLPRTHIPYPLPENYTYGVKCGETQDYAVAKTEENNIQTSQTEDKMPFKENSPHGQNTDKMERSFKSCFLSWSFMWHMLWLSVMQLRHYMFIGTLNPMLNHLAGGDPDLVSRYTNAFAFTQLCGILCAPWNGLIMDRHKGKEREPGQSEQESDLKAAILSLSLTALQCVLFSVCAATPILPLQYLTFILQVLNRSFLYGGNAAFISVAFPPVHFGKLFGAVMALSAVVSLLQYPCFALIKGPLGGDPLYVNIGLTVLSLLAFINPLYVYLHCRRQAAQRASTNSSASS
ncbi:equilibrative nucleobase transporter 1-like [Myxocyprinus asiaticus]|uniref:equilibrative nucleobase transporter 1-like n=1 Tax=Myxocyprinus asiaticus TaxID=70543 RepID=UPI0022220297|nr:equilibrative nucleobase transporter 1-like [Myxocyprinus asiaticus]XP_051506422.1 equilibrative nucleobase transporter 1-like [Myxocyprinus asiaticus]